MTNALERREPNHRGRETARGGGRTAEDDSTAPTDELLELLGDEYARRVLEAVADEPMSAQEIAENAGVSKPTVYRRLEQLEQAGLVEAELAIAADGNHHNRYRTVLESANLRFDGQEIAMSVRTADDRTGRESGPGRRAVAADR